MVEVAENLKRMPALLALLLAALLSAPVSADDRTSPFERRTGAAAQSAAQAVPGTGSARETAVQLRKAVEADRDGPPLLSSGWPSLAARPGITRLSRTAAGISSRPVLSYQARAPPAA